MKDFKEMLTLGRVRGIYNKNGFSKLSEEDLRDLRDWLDLLSDEIYQMRRAAVRELGGRQLEVLRFLDALAGERDHEHN